MTEKAGRLTNKDEDLAKREEISLDRDKIGCPAYDKVKQAKENNLCFILMKIIL